MTILDARGLLCPLPLTLTRRRMAELAPGETLRVLATDPEAPIDLAAWAAEEGHRFRDLSRGGASAGGASAGADDAGADDAGSDDASADGADPTRPGGLVLELRKSAGAPQPTRTAAPPRRGSPPPESSPLSGSRATAWTPPK